MSEILAVDPGPKESGWCRYEGGRVIESGVAPNDKMLEIVIVAAQNEADVLAIEMIASYGMAVGKDVFETCVWIGRFLQAWELMGAPPGRLIYRKDVKLHLCGSPRAKDPNVRQALLDMLGPQGNKKSPGPLYGVKSHAWSAVAVAVTAEATA